MMQVSPEILSLINEAALLVRGDKVEYANSAANRLFGFECGGEPLAKLLGSELAFAQGSAYITERVIRNKTYTVRMTKLEGLRIIVIEASEIAPTLVNDAFVVAMKNALMNISLAVELQKLQCGGQALGSMMLSCYRMQRLMNNVSILRDICSENLNLKLSQFSLRELCQKLIDVAAELIPGMDIYLRCEDEAMIVADREYVMQILLNLISNCKIHASGMSGIIISVHPSQNSIAVSVSDDGCGIESNALGKIFECYKKAADLSEIAKGAGLGLSVVRGLTAAMGGTLLIESRPGRGTVAHFSISRALTGGSLRGRDRKDSECCEDIVIGLAECLSDDNVEML